MKAIRFSCVQTFCQLCVREEICHSETTFYDGSFKCANCRSKTQILNINKAKSSEEELLKKAWFKFIPRKRLTSSKLLQQYQTLLLLWVGIVYIPDPIIESIDLEAVRVNLGNPSERILTSVIKASLESTLTVRLEPLLKFTMDVDSASVAMLRLEVARLFLWRQLGGPLIPFGPLAVLKIPRNRLLERWALKKLDESRDCNGDMKIIHTSGLLQYQRCEQLPTSYCLGTISRR